MQYKCVPAPQNLVIDKRGDEEEAVRSFADIINNEANDGWNFHSMENIAVTQKPGCLAALFGAKDTTTYFNMLVFSKEGNASTSKNVKIIDKNTDNKKTESVKDDHVVPLSDNQLKIVRLNSVVGSAILVDIKLDEQVFQLSNGGEKIFNVINGKHKITAYFNNDDDQLEFEINNNSKVINVFIKPPIKIQEA
jgi:hypothetical protein